MSVKTASTSTSTSSTSLSTLSPALGSTGIELILDNPTNPDGSIFHPQAAFIENVLPVDRRICLAKHDYFCSKIRHQYEIAYQAKQNIKNRTKGKHRKKVAQQEKKLRNTENQHDGDQKNSVTADQYNLEDSIDDLICILLPEADNSLSVLPKISDPFTGSVYHKFVNSYGFCYNQHDPDVLLQFFRNPCFSNDVIREQFMWKPRPKDVQNEIANSSQPVLVKHRVTIGINQLHRELLYIFQKLPDCLAIFGDTNVHFYANKGITTARSNFKYFCSIPTCLAFPEGARPPDELIQFELSGYDTYVFNSEGRIIKIIDHMIVANSSDTSVTLEDALRYLGF